MVLFFALVRAAAFGMAMVCYSALGWTLYWFLGLISVLTPALVLAACLVLIPVLVLAVCLVLTDCLRERRRAVNFRQSFFERTGSLKIRIIVSIVSSFLGYKNINCLYFIMVYQTDSFLESKIYLLPPGHQGEQLDN